MLNVRLFSSYFVYASIEIKDFLFYKHGESTFCAVQFTVPVILSFTFHKKFSSL